METDFNLKLRSGFLGRALGLESLVNDLLKSFFKIKVQAPTKTLSYKASSIAFKTKIDLLYDIGKIDKKQHDGFDKFMNVRNQFMHNVHATSYILVAEHIDGLENWLLKNYPIIKPEQLEILKGLAEIDKTEGGQQEREGRIEFMMLELNYFLMEVIHNMIAKDRKERERYINGMVGYNYYRIIHDNIDKAFDVAFSAELISLVKQKKENISLKELNALLPSLKKTIRAFLDDQVDKEMPRGSTSRDWLESQIANGAKKAEENLGGGNGL